MSSQLPPSENLPIFDSSVFTVGDEALTYNKALKYFLRYPYAQGTETLATTNVSGVLTANSTSVFNDDVTINNTAAGVVNPLTLYDPLSGKSTIITNSGGSMNLITSSQTNSIFFHIGGSNLLTLTSASLSTYVPLPAPTDNTTKIATTAWVNTFNKPATTMLVTATSANASYYLPVITASTTANYPMFVPSGISLNPSTSTLSCPIVSASTSVTSPLVNTTSGGTVRLTGTTGQYSQFQQSGVGFGYDLNLYIPPKGALNILTRNIYSLPSGTDTTTAGLGIGWNATSGGGETDFINYSQGSSSGGYNFYNIGGANTVSLIAQISRAQPAPNDNSTILATTAWVNTFSKPASDILVTATSDNATYYMPIITAGTTDNYPLFVPSTVGINPSVGSIITEDAAIYRKTTIQPSSIEVRDTTNDPLGDPINTVITPDLIQFQNGNGSYQTSSMSTHNINFTNNTTGLFTEISTSSITMSDNASIQLNTITNTSILLQDTNLGKSTNINAGSIVADTWSIDNTGLGTFDTLTVNSISTVTVLSLAGTTLTIALSLHAIDKSWSVTLNSNCTILAPLAGVNGGVYKIWLTVGALPRTFTKACGVINNLLGDTLMAAGSVWLITIYRRAASTYRATFDNFT